MKDTENPAEDLQPTAAPAVAVVIKKKENLVSLISTGLSIAKMHHGILTDFLLARPMTRLIGFPYLLNMIPPLLFNSLLLEKIMSVY